MSDAWTLLTDLSSLIDGDAWEHLASIDCSGTGGTGLEVDASLLTVLRYTIGDFGSDLKYTDSELNSLLALAALYVNQEMDFENTYIIGIEPASINPDPVVEGDIDFANFVVLRAACLSDEWLTRERAIIEGITAVCDSMRMSIRSSNALEILIENGPCETYQQLKQEYQRGIYANVRAVLSPFTSNTYNPEYG
jgi:hypothetical protein